MQRILCLKHDEQTPSCVVYPTHAYCYAGCGRISLEEIDPSVQPRPRPDPEDISATLQRINLLPLVPIRGLMLPADSDSYFISFDQSYA